MANDSIEENEAMRQLRPSLVGLITCTAVSRPTGGVRLTRPVMQSRSISHE
jgi:hypothetical protein